MESALPLGMMPEADFSVMRFKLAEGDRLVLMLDGIVEATDADGRLFGFERIHDPLRTTSSAAEVARAAQSLGRAKLAPRSRKLRKLVLRGNGLMAGSHCFHRSGDAISGSRHSGAFPVQFFISDK
jgi:Stage II sporulation protein E (SpoIIE)